MPGSAIILRDGNDVHRLPVTHRDWMLLWGRPFKEGPPFSDAFGVYEHFTVARGMPVGSRVTRLGRVLYEVTQSLLSAVERDAELLRYDYTFGFIGSRARHGGGQSITVGGRHGIISVRPSGYCTIELFDPAVGKGLPEVSEVIDLRAIGSVRTESGVVKAYRRKAEMHWPGTLPPLLDFLRPRLDEELIVEHLARVG